MATISPILERRPSIQDIRDVPLLAQTCHQRRYCHAGTQKYRKPPVLFTVQLSRQLSYQDDQAICYPGAVIEGTVHLELAEPLAAQHLKLVFKASERINYEALGWGHPRRNEGRLFAIRTTLWGSQNQESNESTPVWPILEIGKHSFPFVCELPLVNYPPSISHRLVSCAFSFVASLERPGERPFQTRQCQIQFRPRVETEMSKALCHFTDEKSLNQWTVAHIQLPSLSYNLLDTSSIPVRLSIKAGHTSSIAHVRVCLKRCMRIINASFYRNETQLISQEEKTLRVSEGNGDLIISLPLPSGIAATLRFCRQLSLEYKITVSARMRRGPLWSKRKLFCVPIVLGTLPAGTSSTDVRVYTDNHVVQDTSLGTKPKFLRAPRIEDQLPAYDALRPPEYTPLAFVS